MLARCTTYVLDGITAHPVTVECDVRPGLPSFTLIGLPDGTARELRDTVHAAVRNCGYRFPDQRVTINIAPSWLRRVTPSLPLAAAVAVLAAAGEISADQVADVAVYGRLTLGGEIAALPGALAATATHRLSGFSGPLLYAGQALPADLASCAAAPIAHLSEIPGVSAAPRGVSRAAEPPPAGPLVDFADVRAHEHAIFALTVAAAGGHHVLLRGAPGSGATMLARRLQTILPPLSPEQQREVATIRDAAGLPLGDDSARPFRAPHHTITAAGLVVGPEQVVQLV